VNAVTFAEDIETVLRWVGRPVILYGHSAGSVAAAIVAGYEAALLDFLKQHS